MNNKYKPVIFTNGYGKEIIINRTDTHWCLLRADSSVWLSKNETIRLIHMLLDMLTR